MPPRRSFATLPLLAALPLVAGQARGQDVQWGNSSGGSFHVGANWIGGVVPAAGDSVRFSRTRSPDQQLAYTVSFGSSPSNVQMSVGGDRVTLDLNGNVYFLTSQLDVMRIGTSTIAPSRLTLIDGTLATTTPDAGVRIGAAANATGVLTISTGAQCLGPFVVVGDVGPGTLLVQNGGDLVGGPMHVGYGAPGTATVSGVGSALVVELLNIGVSAPGTLNINTGARVESTTGQIGQRSGVIGTVNVNGAGSRWTSSTDVYAGYTGPGVLNISDGGRVQCTNAYVGVREGGLGSANVSGTGVLVAQGRCRVGYGGQGSLSVTSGGLVQCDSGEIGVVGPGTATIDGAGSRWVSFSDLSIGAADGTSVLALTGGGTAHCTSASLGRFPGGTATVNVSGTDSRWFVIQGISIGGVAETSQLGGVGALTIGPGGSVAANEIWPVDSR